MNAIGSFAAVPDSESSPGVWQLAWRRLRGDRVAMVALAVVAAYAALVVASLVGLVAADWTREVGVPYANPRFLGPVSYTHLTLPTIYSV